MFKIKINEFRILNEDTTDTKIAKEYLQLFCRTHLGEIPEENLTVARQRLTGSQGVICVQLLRHEFRSDCKTGGWSA